MNAAVRCIAVLCALSFLIFVPGIVATWLFAEGDVDNGAASIGLSLSEFLFAPEEILPTGPDAPVGEDHLALIEMILYEVSYGLNATKKPIIHNTLNNKGDVIFCDQKVQGGNLKHLMIDGLSESERLYFVIEMISESEYVAYTLRYADIRNNSIGTEIEVYRTVLQRDSKGVWDDISSALGVAKVNDPSIVSRAIDVTTWRKT